MRLGRESGLESGLESDLRVVKMMREGRLTSLVRERQTAFGTPVLWVRYLIQLGNIPCYIALHVVLNKVLLLYYVYHDCVEITW